MVAAWSAVMSIAVAAALLIMAMLAAADGHSGMLLATAGACAAVSILGLALLESTGRDRLDRH